MYRERDVTLAYLLLMFAGYDYSGWYGSQPGYQLSLCFICQNQATGDPKVLGQSQQNLHWSQTRVNWEGCDRKGIRRKTGGLQGLCRWLFSWLAWQPDLDGAVDTITVPLATTECKNITWQGCCHTPATNRSLEDADRL